MLGSYTIRFTIGFNLDNNLIGLVKQGNVNNGDGSGTYRNGEVTITNNGDGSGTYRDSKTTIAVNGDGSGTYRDDVITVAINGDGSGSRSLTGRSSRDFSPEIGRAHV